MNGNYYFFIKIINMYGQVLQISYHSILKTAVFTDSLLKWALKQRPGEVLTHQIDSKIFML